MERVSFLKHAQHQFIVELAVALTAVVFAPRDLCPSGFMYILLDGIVLYRGELLNRGAVWGEDQAMLKSEHLRQQHSARALKHVTTLHIDHGTLMEIALRYPKTYKAIRKDTIRMAIRREFIYQAGLAKARRQEVEISPIVANIRSSQKEDKRWSLAPGEHIDTRVLLSDADKAAVGVGGPSALAPSNMESIRRLEDQLSRLTAVVSQMDAKLDRVMKATGAPAPAVAAFNKSDGWSWTRREHRPMEA